MRESQLRPFYHDFAWAYECILETPVAERCDFIEHVIAREQPHGGRRLLDAGCGPGHYSVCLAERGFQVTGLDWSRTFVQQAQQAHGRAGDGLRFIHGNIARLPELDAFDVILCRGVLNDLNDPVERQQVFHEFARVLHPRGLLLFDVREWTATVERSTRRPEVTKEVRTDRGVLTFRSKTTLNVAERQMVVQEQHLLRGGDGEIERTHEFVMRCWTRDEVLEKLQAAHFEVVREWGAYDEDTAPGMTDRMVICARLPPG